MDDNYTKLIEGLAKVGESRGESGTAPTPGFWVLSGASLPSSLDDAIEKNFSRESLLQEMTSGDEPPTLGKWSTLKVQIFRLATFERDCRARHSKRSDSYVKAVEEAKRRTANQKALTEELEAISEK